MLAQEVLFSILSHCGIWWWCKTSLKEAAKEVKSDLAGPAEQAASSVHDLLSQPAKAGRKNGNMDPCCILTHKSRLGKNANFNFFFFPFFFEFNKSFINLGFSLFLPEPLG